MFRRALLGSTAITAAAFAVTVTAHAGSVGSGDGLDVSISGEYRFHITLRDQDVSAGFGRGYNFRSGEAELGVVASNTADNGIIYGVEFALDTNTDDTNNSSEVYAFIDDEKLSRLELGDQDDAIDRMIVAGEDALAGRQAWDGEVGSEFNFGTTWIGAATNNTGKATKATYFSPRIEGFQVGASFTPDAGAAGASFGETDNDGDFENVFGLAANYVGNYDKLTVILSVGAEYGDGVPNSGGGTTGISVGDVDTFVVGGTIAFSGFTFGAGYGDLGEAGITAANQALGQDAGEWWNVGAGYRSGPWGVSVGYIETTMGNSTGTADTENTVLSFDADYSVAPGWDVIGNLSFIDAENISRTTTDNDGSLFILYNRFLF